jgi:excisionase family DNA binding protein
MAAIEIFTPDELAELLRVPSNRVVLLAKRGEIPFLTIDGRLRFDARDVEDWLRSQRSDAPLMPPRIVNTTG